MTASKMVSDWTTEVIGFLSRNVPVFDGGRGWASQALSAYQMGCLALVALGQADDTDWGASPRKDPRVPDVLPRWDDVCVAVLKLAAQQGQLAYRLPDGSEAPPRTGARLKLWG